MPADPIRTEQWAIGLDVGGTKIAGGLVDLASGRLTGRIRIPTVADRGGRAILTDALAVAGQLAAEAARRGVAVAGIGVGVPELVDRHGQVRSGHRVAWSGLDVAGAFGAIAPAALEADVRAAALAEARFGAGAPYADFAYVTVGTGISACLVQSGRPYPGARGGALVLANGPISFTCPRCGAQGQHVVEDSATGPALVERFRRAGGTAEGAEDVMAAAEAGDAAAAGIIAAAAATLGCSIGFMVNLLDPEVVVIGGGLGLSGGLFGEALTASIRRHVWDEELRHLPVLPAALGPDAGVIGAALVGAGASGDKPSGGGRLT
jgi:predicted NBD/HSP70 family sugar kinase